MVAISQTIQDELNKLLQRKIKEKINPEDNKKKEDNKSVGESILDTTTNILIYIFLAMLILVSLYVLIQPNNSTVIPVPV